MSTRPIECGKDHPSAEECKKTLKRFRIYGYYTDESQVTVDIVDAIDLDTAEQIILKIRGDEYTSDGGSALEDEIKLIQEEIAKSHAEVQKDLDDLAKMCGANEPESCEDCGYEHPRVERCPLYCDECGALLETQNDQGNVSQLHNESCSLHPSAAK